MEEKHSMKEPLSIGLLVAGTIALLGVVFATSLLITQRQVGVGKPQAVNTEGPQVLQASNDISQCLNVSIYTVNGSTWTKVTNFQTISPGQTVRIAALAGGTNTRPVDKARFRVNGEPAAWIETTDKNPYGEYFISYIFPTSSNPTFSIDAEVHDTQDGWK